MNHKLRMSLVYNWSQEGTNISQFGTQQLLLKRAAANRILQGAAAYLGVGPVQQIQQAACSLDGLKLLHWILWALRLIPLSILYIQTPFYSLFKAFVLYVNCGVIVWRNESNSSCPLASCFFLLNREKSWVLLLPNSQIIRTARSFCS